MKKFLLCLVILLTAVLQFPLSAQVSKTINDVKKGNQQANEAKKVAEETIQTGKDIFIIFKSIKKAKESRFIIIPGISYQDKNFTALRKALVGTKKVIDVDIDYKDDTATISFVYKNSLHDLWDQLSSTLHESFDVVTIKEPAILLSYKFAKAISGSSRQGSLQMSGQSDKSPGNAKNSSNSPEEKSKNRGGDHVDELDASSNLTGSLHPEVKYLDVEYFSYFNSGSALVGKGNTNALIDAKGNIIVPFNTYKFWDFRYGEANHSGEIPASGFTRKGLYRIGKGGVLNSKGQWVGKETGTSAASPKFTSDGKYTVYPGKIMDATGKIYKITGGEISDVSDDIVTIWELIPNRVGQIRYKTLNDQFITAETYAEADNFSDGMALVSKKDEFSVMRYGFIDKSGSLKIPLQFSIRPGRFSSGLARVVPKNQQEFEYGYIDKSGNVVIKHTRADVQKYGVFRDFQNGLAFSPRYIMDTNGNIQSHEEWLAGFGVKVDAQTRISLVIYGSGPRVFAENDNRIRYRKQIKSSGEILTGCVDMQTGKIIEGPFVESLFTLQFDPISKLAYAKMKTGKNEKGLITYREGFINEDGQFVIVKGSGSQW